MDNGHDKILLMLIGLNSTFYLFYILFELAIVYQVK